MKLLGPSVSSFLDLVLFFYPIFTLSFLLVMFLIFKITLVILGLYILFRLTLILQRGDASLVSGAGSEVKRLPNGVRYCSWPNSSH